MTLINASMLAGVLLAGLPILLHLMMRAKPKRIEFPALRLLKTRQTSNSRRMRLRQILLLLLRALLIAAAVAALARPSLPAARYGLLWYEWLLLIAVAAAAFGWYYWRSVVAERTSPAEHLLRERRGRLRAFSLLGGLLAALLFVGLPWGFRLQAEITAPRSALTADVPVAAIFAFDNSLSMEYKHQGQTRLQQASTTALEHLRILPGQSRVAISTASPDSETVFQADLAGVRSRIEDLKTHAVPRSLNAVLKEAIDAHVGDRDQVQQETGSTDSFVREIYLFTDLSEAAWQSPDEAGLHDLLVQHDWLQIYMIDVSVDQPLNVALTQLRLDRQTTVTEQPVNISVAVTGTPAANPDVVLELFTLDDSGSEIRGGGIIGSPQRTVQLGATAPVVTFAVRGAAGAESTSGLIRVASPDPLSVDDVLYFTFGVTPVPRVLLVGDRDLDTWLVQNVLQPSIAGVQNFQRFDTTAVTPAEFRNQNLSSYDVICVLNWARPPESAWSDLRRFVENGGALFLTTGGEKTLQAGFWTTPDSEQLLPGLPLLPVRFRGDPARLNLVADDHPVVSSFNNRQDAQTELNRAIFDRAWTFSPHPDTRVLMSFAHRNTVPALLERSVGAGRVLLFASAMDNNGTNKWNEDFVVDNWSFLMLVDELMKYLTGAADAEHNFVTGEPVEIPVPSDQRFSQYRVARPRIRLTRGLLPFDESSVLLTDIDEPGHYQLRTTDEGNAFRFQFAANITDAESNLTPMTDESLNEILGKDRYSKVQNPDELDRAVNLGRLGVEVFPVLMGLVILLFCAEHLMANFFYDTEPAPDPALQS